MQLSTLVPVLQGVALAPFCFGLILGVFRPSRMVASFVAVHAGVVLLAAACAIFDGEVCSRAVQLLFVALQFSILQLAHRFTPLWVPGPAPTLLEAVEVTLALSGASRGGIIGCEMAYTASLLAALLVLSAHAARIVSRPMHSFLSREDGFPMAVLALVLTSGIMLRSLHCVFLLPVTPGIYVSQADVAWLALFVALSSSQSLYSRGVHGGGRVSASVVLALPAVVACCLTYLGDLSAGASLALAACCVMVRCGRTLREVRLAALSGVALPLLLSAFVPNMSGCWGAWLSAGGRLSLDGVSTRGWMGHVLLCFGVPGAVCLVLMSACAVLAGARSILGDDDTGVMVPFLCLSYGIELATDTLGAVWVIPPFLSSLVPFSGITDPLALPLVSGLAVAVAMACDLRVTKMVADDPGVAWRFMAAGPRTQRDIPLLPPGSAGGELR